MNGPKVFLCLFVLCFHTFHLCVAEGKLRVGFYNPTCPKAESIVKSVVREAARQNPRMPPMLLRLHFHDCFVEGCDGSILITGNRDVDENQARGHQGVDGFDQIEQAKRELEAQCPGVVSCADIVAMAARDAVALSGGPVYEVETGRRDGRISNASLADAMPEVDDSIDTLKSKFKNKGLSEKELVLLSGGAHTIGTTACFFMPQRLYNFSGKHDNSDPKINPSFLPELKRLCPINVDINFRIALDFLTNETFDDQIMRNIKNGFAVIASDARLYDDKLTKQAVDTYANGPGFGQDFAKAMVVMGRIGVKTGSDGEIRRVCDSFN